MDEQELKESLATYKAQLGQVEQALLASGSQNEDLLELKRNLNEVIQLTSDSLLALKKAMVIQSIDAQCDDSQQLSVSADGSESTGQSVDNHTDDIIGTCVRASYQHEWGPREYHNAAIIGLDPQNEKVKVMFLQPTHASMRICPFYLDDKCKFSDQDCKLSHGHDVDIADLHEFHQSKARFLNVGDLCLAKYSEDELWYKASVVDKLDNDIIQVMFDDYGEETFVAHLDDVTTFVDTSDTSDSSDEEPERTTPDILNGLEDEKVDIPSYLWKPSSHDNLADWEQHTRGIGSKLMTSMGYKAGNGLGKQGQGRVDPVPILKLPPGKSLDRIMQLKQKTGNKEMFDVMKNKERRKKLAKADVFSYLNKSLSHGEKVDLRQYKSKTGGRRSNKNAAGPSVISRAELNKKSDRCVNVQMVQTEEEIRKVESEILSIKRRLEVNLSRRDSGGIKHLNNKLRSTEKYLQTLQNSSRELHRNKSHRESKKSLAIF